MNFVISSFVLYSISYHAYQAPVYIKWSQSSLTRQVQRLNMSVPVHPSFISYKKCNSWIDKSDLI